MQKNEYIIISILFVLIGIFGLQEETRLISVPYQSPVNINAVTSQKTYNISGIVYDNFGTGLAGVLVTNLSYQNTTIPSGHYFIPRLPNGTYNFSYNKPGFDTGYLELSVNGSGLINQNKIIYGNSSPVISAIISSRITSGGASISWTTNEASDTQVEYGPTTSNGSSTTLDKNLIISHSQVLSGLTASTLYHYRVKSRDAAGNLAISSDQTFTTSASDSSLKVYYKFDEKTGTTATDSSGNNNNGMIRGPAHVSGKLGNALSFDGANDYVDAGNQESLNIVDAITIEAWVNPKLITGISRVIAAKSSVYYFQINRNGGLEIYFYGTANPGYHQMTSTIPLNTWTHVAVTYNGSMVVLYKNRNSQSFDDTRKLVSNSDESVFIGSEEGGIDRLFGGLIDEVKIYNRALSASEIIADAS